MTFSDLPATAAWGHGNTRAGFEAVAFGRRRGGWVATGSTTAVEAGTPWWVAYEVELDAAFATRRATVTARVGGDVTASLQVETDGRGRWSLDGTAAPELDGCLDIDLESSAMTNALPMRRADLAVGETLSAPAAYVRVKELAVERLEQHYVRREDGDQGPIFRYHAPAFEFSCDISYDGTGLVLSYPGIADRLV
ncbi:putative glycolipid-binding domain-containing protein [Pseudarthrobacter sp. S9]|uniref:putative glycolipid-binding domain-containing protein n=1 Tax=Pseudarthrobacter sp. S9 TaxID=3418421 RepID=UPI003CFE30F5